MLIYFKKNILLCLLVIKESCNTESGVSLSDQWLEHLQVEECWKTPSSFGREILGLSNILYSNLCFMSSCHAIVESCIQ